MTAVFLGGGAGVAMAHDQAPQQDRQDLAGLSKLNLEKIDAVKQARDQLDKVLNTVPGFPDDHLGTHQKSKHGPDHRWHDDRDCGCEQDEPEKVTSEDEDEDQDCDSEQAAPEESKTEKIAPEETKTEKIAPEESTPKVESVASTSPESQVESTATSPSSVEDTTPVGAADTGDGSSSPGFTPTFTPAGSSSPLENPFALGGGAAAAALAGAYGVRFARRRTGAHRG